MNFKRIPLMEAPEDNYTQTNSGLFVPPDVLKNDKKQEPEEVPKTDTQNTKDSSYKETVESLKEKYPDIAQELDRSVQLTTSFKNNYTEWVEALDKMNMLKPFVQKFSKGYIFNYLLESKNLSLDNIKKYGWLTNKSFYEYDEPDFKYVWNILTNVTDNSRRFFGDQYVSWKDFTYGNQGQKFFPTNIAGKQLDANGNPDPNTIWGKVDLLQARAHLGKGTRTQKLTRNEVTRQMKNELKMDNKQIDGAFKLFSQLNDYD